MRCSLGVVGGHRSSGPADEATAQPVARAVPPTGAASVQRLRAAMEGRLCAEDNLNQQFFFRDNTKAGEQEFDENSAEL